MQNFFSKYVLQFYYSYYMIHSLLNLRMWNTERSDYKVMHKFSTAQELVFFTPMFFQERESLQTCWPLPRLPSGKIQNASSFLIGRFFLSCVGGMFLSFALFSGGKEGHRLLLCLSPSSGCDFQNFSIIIGTKLAKKKKLRQSCIEGFSGPSIEWHCLSSNT